MKSKTVVVAVLATLLVTAGAAAAAPGNAPTDAGSAASNHSATGAANADGPNAEAANGPAGSLPERVPDHVSRIHDAVRQFLDGELDGTLGEAVSGIVGGGSAPQAE